MARRAGVPPAMNRDRMARAAVELTVERGWAGVTATAIAQRAGVNRSTFHRNFPSKEDAVRRWYGMLVEEGVAEQGDAPDDMATYLEVLFGTFERHKGELLALHAHGLSHLMLDALMELFGVAAPQARERDAAFDGDETGGALPVELAASVALSYHVGGIFASLLLWFDGGMVIGADEFARACAAALPRSARPVLPRVRRASAGR